MELSNGNIDSNSELKSLEETLAEHIKEQKVHIEALQSADEALTKAQRELIEGRQRLQNALNRYRERMNGSTV